MEILNVDLFDVTFVICPFGPCEFEKLIHNQLYRATEQK